jgi:peptidyl-prolyl cis-trans isomerase A (cyclophilin A)
MKQRLMKRLLASAVVLGGLSSLPAQAQQYVCMDSTVGSFCLQLLRDHAPLTVDNFLNYVQSGAYENTIVHRSEQRVSGEKFVIQSGGYTADGAGYISTIPTEQPVPHEFSVSNLRGTVAMATVPGDPNSATSQWFINLSDNSSVLDFQNGGATVFAQIASGMEVVDTIANLGRANLSRELGTAFSQVPVTTTPDTMWIGPSNLVLIKNVYALEHLYYNCSPDSPQDTLSTLCDDHSLTFPVRVGDTVYTTTLVRDFASEQFSATIESLRELSEVPAQTATFDPATGTLFIPSVRVGSQIFTNLVWELVGMNPGRFTLVGYTRF